LGQAPNGQSYIETVPKQGYRFTLQPHQISVKKYPLLDLPVETDGSLSGKNNGFVNLHSEEISYLSIGELERSAPPDLIENSEIVPSLYETGKSPETVEKIEEKTAHGKRRFSLKAKVIVLVLFLLFASAVAAPVIYYFRSEKPQQTSAGVVKSIAVLPFKPIGGEIDREKFGLGIADSIITQLSQLHEIEVRPTSAVFSYTDQPSTNPVETGEELGVDAVLEGTVQQEGGRVRVSVQLIQVSQGKPLWSETFNENMSDIFAFQDLISRKVVTALSIRLTPQQERVFNESGTTNPEAFQDYQMGIYFWNRRTKEDLFKAVEYFQQAIGHDPNYAEAYAGLADTFSMLAFYGFANVREMNEKARTAAQKALSINESLGVAYAALANTEIIENNFTKAKELLERAITLSPYNASAHQRYGFVLLVLGQLDETVREMRLAQKYDPLSPAINKALCNALISKRNFSEAIEYCERAVELSPETPGNRPSLAFAYFHNGRFNEAVNQINLELKSGAAASSVIGTLAYFYAKSGRAEEAKKIYEQLKREYKNDQWLAVDLTIVGYTLGKKDEAFSYFKKMLELNDTNPSMRVIVAFDPTLDEIRADPRFASIIPRYR
jgi:TolB-like protein/tetratricopeptide (TPR) repeat protein